MGDCWTVTALLNGYLFVIDLKSRRVQIANISHQTCGNVLEQVARNWTDAYEGFLKNHRYLIHDRDPLFINRFTEILRDSGVQTLKLPARSPNLNAFAERFVGSIRRECLDHVIPLGEQHLRTIIREYVEHYNAERHHQGAFSKNGVGFTFFAPPDRIATSTR